MQHPIKLVLSLSLTKPWAEGTCFCINEDVVHKLDTNIQSQQSTIVKNREALSKLMVDIQQMSSKLNSLSNPVLIPTPSSEASPQRPAMPSLNSGFPTPPPSDNPPKAFKFNFLCFDGTDSYKWCKSANNFSLSTIHQTINVSTSSRSIWTTRP